MEFPKLNKDLAIISKLGDNPNIDDDLSSDGLKSKFDEAALILQKYLNEELVAELDRLFAGGDSVPVDGLNMNGAINMNNNPLQNVRDPSSEHEALNLRYALKHFLSTARNINGKSLETDIVLNAEDVGARPNTWLPTVAEIGARPNTWLPTVAEIGARPNTWLPTIAEIGAAPAGYGLGGGSKWIANRNQIDGSGFYQLDPEGKDMPDDYAWWGTVSKLYGNTHIFTATRYDGCVAQSMNIGSGWKPWEWVNPPMTPGVEYRTTERINSKEVYKKADSDGKIMYRLDGETAWKYETTSKKLLWHNAAPYENTFAAQTLSLDLSNYDSIEIVFTADPNALWEKNIAKFVKDSYGHMQVMGHTRLTGGQLFSVQRLVYPTNTGILFEGAYYKFVGDEISIENSTYLVPVRIYGIKEAT